MMSAYLESSRRESGFTPKPPSNDSYHLHIEPRREEQDQVKKIWGNFFHQIGAFAVYVSTTESFPKELMDLSIQTYLLTLGC